MYATRHAIARPDYDDNVEFMKFSERNRVLFVGAENCAIIASRQQDGVHLNELHNKLLSNYIKGKITQIVGFECE
jgi:hypothetical protein